MSEEKQITYSHKELSAKYFPGILPQSASTYLSRWIARDEELLTELQSAGYVRRQKLYTPLQVEILMKHLGDPDKRTDD